MTNDELEKLIEKLVNTAQRGTRQTRDGSHLDLDKIKEQQDKLDDTYFSNLKSFSKSLSDIEESISNADSTFDGWVDGLRQAGKTNSEIQSLRNKYKDDLQKNKDSIIKNLEGLDEAISKAKKDIEAQAKQESRENVERGLSRGKSDQIRRKGESIKEFGNSLKNISGGKGSLGKFGDSLTKFGGAMGKYSVYIAVAVEAIKKFRELLMGLWEASILKSANAYDYQSTAMGINTEQIRSENNMKLMAQKANNQMLSSSIQFSKTATQALGALAQDQVAAYGELGNEGVKIGAEGYSIAHEIAAKAPFDIKGAAYAAANAALELGGQATMFEKNKGFAEENVALSKQKTASEIANAHTQFQTDVSLLHTQTQNELNLREKQKNVSYESQTRDLAVKRNQQEYEENRAAWNAPTFGLATTVGDFFGWETYHKAEQTKLEGDAMLRKRELDRELAYAEYNTAFMNTEAERKAMITKAQSELANMQIQNEIALNKSKIQTQKTYENTLIESAKKINKAWMDMTQALNDEFLKMEKSSMTMGREIGLTGEQLHSYSQSMGQIQVAVSKWGKNLEWMQKQQGAYQESTGRNIQYTEKDFTTSAAVGTLVGDDIVGELNAGMEIFNTSVADSNTQFYEMYKSVSKIGLNGKKYAKDLIKNLSLAEKYNFKGGVKNLMEMSKWAQNMRFNVGSIDGMLDKVQEGGLEGIIKQAAELQVLGGNFAMGSDPLAMAYESYMDPEAYAKRMNSMIAGQGMFDEKTGEVSFGIASQQMMRQFAKSTGQDYKDVLNQARQQAKISQINKNLDQGQGFSEEQQSLIANKAQYNKDTQQWEVTTLDGQVKNVNELTQSDMENLGPAEGEDPDKSMVELQTQMLEKLGTIYSKQESMEIAQTEMKSFLIGDKWLALENTNQAMIDTVRKEFFDNYNIYSKEVDENLKTIKNSLPSFVDIWKHGNTEIDNVRKAVNKAAEDITKTVGTCWKQGMSYIDKAMSIVAKGMGIDFNLPEFKLEKVAENQNRTSEEKPKNKNFFRDVILPGYTGHLIGGFLGGGIAAGTGLYHYLTDDGKIDTNGVANSINDGAVYQNGKITKINEKDQVLAAKNGGPIDRLVDGLQSLTTIASPSPRPMQYDSYVRENPYGNGGGSENDNGKIEIAPIQININGNIQISGANGTTDITQQIANDPNFIRSLSQMISLEVEKKVRGGRVNNPLNRGLVF